MADLLVICTDVAGLYDADPRAHPEASLVPVVDRVTASVHAMAGGIKAKGKGEKKLAKASLKAMLVDDGAFNQKAHDEMMAKLFPPL